METLQMGMDLAKLIVFWNWHRLIFPVRCFSLVWTTRHWPTHWLYSISHFALLCFFTCVIIAELILFVGVWGCRPRCWLAVGPGSGAAASRLPRSRRRRDWENGPGMRVERLMVLRCNVAVNTCLQWVWEERPDPFLHVWESILKYASSELMSL